MPALSTRLKLLYLISCSFGLLGVVISIASCFTSSLWAICLGRCLQGFSVGAARQLEAEYIDDMHSDQRFPWESVHMLDELPTIDEDPDYSHE